MKKYLIWLKSGSCISGAITDWEAEKLLEKFNRPQTNHHTIKDTEGTLVVDIREIAAIGLNNIPKEDEDDW